MDFGDRLKSLRHLRKWTQMDLARKSGIGQSKIAGYESGRIPNAETVKKFAQVLEVTTDYLLGMDNEVNEKEEVDIADIKRDFETKPLTIKGKLLPEVKQEYLREMILKLIEMHEK